MAWRNHLVESSPNTNMHPAFGSKYKIERNVAITTGVFRLNGGPMAHYRVQSLSEDSNDPLRRNPHLMYLRTREEFSNAGRMRGKIRPAAPGQVTWKNSYWLQQRTRATRPTRIGPYTQGSLEKQSILYRISDAFSALGRGGK
jgi:hypothetical protein